MAVKTERTNGIGRLPNIWQKVINKGGGDYIQGTIVFKKNGPPTTYKFQVHNIAHAPLLEAPVYKMTQWNNRNMLYFEI